MISKYKQLVSITSDAGPCLLANVYWTAVGGIHQNTPSFNSNHRHGSHAVRFMQNGTSIMEVACSPSYTIRRIVYGVNYFVLPSPESSKSKSPSQRLSSRVSSSFLKKLSFRYENCTIQNWPAKWTLSAIFLPLHLASSMDIAFGENWLLWFLNSNAERWDAEEWQ